MFSCDFKVILKLLQWILKQFEMDLKTLSVDLKFLCKAFSTNKIYFKSGVSQLYQRFQIQ
jgi:hypothetical protein